MRVLMTGILLAGCTRETLEFEFDGEAGTGLDFELVWKAPWSVVETDVVIDAQELCLGEAPPHCIMYPGPTTQKVRLRIDDAPSEGFVSITGDMVDKDGNVVDLCERDDLHGTVNAQYGGERIVTGRYNENNAFGISLFPCWVGVVYPEDDG